VAPGQRPRAIGFLRYSFGGFGISLADGIWAVLYGTDRDPLPTLGCALASVGAALVSLGLLRAKPFLMAGFWSRAKFERQGLAALGGSPFLTRPRSVLESTQDTPSGLRPDRGA